MFLQFFYTSSSKLIGLTFIEEKRRKFRKPLYMRKYRQLLYCIERKTSSLLYFVLIFSPRPFTKTFTRLHVKLFSYSYSWNMHGLMDEIWVSVIRIKKVAYILRIAIIYPFVAERFGRRAVFFVTDGSFIVSSIFETLSLLLPSTMPSTIFLNPYRVNVRNTTNCLFLFLSPFFIYFLPLGKFSGFLNFSPQESHHSI